MLRPYINKFHKMDKSMFFFSSEENLKFLRGNNPRYNIIFNQEYRHEGFFSEKNNCFMTNVHRQ